MKYGGATMGTNIGTSEKAKVNNSKQNCDKYLSEYDIIKNKLPLVGKEELFSLLVELMKMCKKLQLSMPSEYVQYYTQTRKKLIDELRSLEKRVVISQINNVNYADLEVRIINITRKLGLTA